LKRHARETCNRSGCRQLRLSADYGGFTEYRFENQESGISYLPFLLKDKKLSKPQYFITASDEGPALITNEGWKLRYCKPRGKFELYNLRKDPQEKYDVILRFPEKAKELESIVLKDCDGNLDNGIYF